MIAEVIPEKRTNSEKNTFSYIVPDELHCQVKVGSIVDVPFGKKEIRGVVSQLNDVISTPQELRVEKTYDERSFDSTQRVPFGARDDNKKYELKEIKKVDPNFVVPKEYIDVAQWVAEYYLCSLGEAISLFLPPKITRPRKEVTNQVQGIARDHTKLTNEQAVILEELKKDLCNDSAKKPALLYGVTGSGKTEIYIKLAKGCLRIGKQVIVLVPEIMLTPQTVEKFEKAFPTEICLMHSGLSQSERYLSYKQFYGGEKKIIIGPRSALLVPSSNIGLIIIDEEQEDAYKQERDPRYHATELAKKIASQFRALLLLGSATPRVESYFKAKSGAYKLYELKNRYQKLLLPPSKIVDLKDEIKLGNFSPISLELQKSLAEVLSNKRHAILFLNRRGMATFVSCRECGEVILCPKCNIPMVYHVDQKQHFLNCHHCDYKMAAPTTCPNCNSLRIKFFGAGVDKIEKEIAKLFPKARIRRIDSKSLQNKNEYVKLYDEFKSGKIDVLIGTQILAKGLDLGTVDLVGVISADVGLHLPQFRANEKTFSLITQVSGRSGRGDNAGKTVIQTYWPEAFAIKMSSSHDYKKFYEQEIVERKEFNYPPFCHLVRVVAENRSQVIAKKEINAVAAELKAAKINLIGPAKCFLSKINNKFRYHLIIRTSDKSDQKLYQIFLNNQYLVWDKDPINLL